MLQGPSVPRCGSRAGTGAQVSIFKVNKSHVDLVLCWCQCCSDLDYRFLLVVFFQCLTPSNNRSEPLSCLRSSHRHLRQGPHNRLPMKILHLAALKGQAEHELESLTIIFGGIKSSPSHAMASSSFSASQFKSKSPSRVPQES